MLLDIYVLKLLIFHNYLQIAIKADSKSVNFLITFIDPINIGVIFISSHHICNVNNQGTVEFLEKYKALKS